MCSKEKGYTRLISPDVGRSIVETQTKQSGAETADQFRNNLGVDNEELSRCEFEWKIYSGQYLEKLVLLSLA